MFLVLAVHIFYSFDSISENDIIHGIVMPQGPVVMHILQEPLYVNVLRSHLDKLHVVFVKSLEQCKPTYEVADLFAECSSVGMVGRLHYLLTELKLIGAQNTDQYNSFLFT